MGDINEERYNERGADGRFVEKEKGKIRESTIRINSDLKKRLLEIWGIPKESYRVIIERLIKEHYVLYLLKQKLNIKKEEHETKETSV